jgi:hypothetical protein
MKTKLFLLCLTFALQSVQAELRTLTMDASVTNSSATLTISSNQTIEMKTAMAQVAACGAGGPLIIWSVNGITFTNQVGLPAGNMIFAGPASVQLYAPNCAESKAIATFDVQPSAFPPDKALTLGAFSGNVMVTMEESTDLVNWTASASGNTYTNAPDARFFRIKMEKNAPPPP